MKVKPTSKPGRVVVEVDRKDERLLARSAEAAAPPLFRLRKILVPLDFSECSKKALQYALPFARQSGASLMLLHVIQLSYAAGEFGAPEALASDVELRNLSQKQLQALAEQEAAVGVPVQVLVRTGRPADEIVRAARELEADLIIISTHGHTGLKHVLFGSTTEQVVRHAPCPVLTVREREQDFVPPR